MSDGDKTAKPGAGDPPGTPSPSPPAAGAGTPTPAPSNSDAADSGVLKTRAWTGLLVVIFGDIAIALAAILAVVHVTNSGQNGSLVVSIASSAFTAIGTMTTAYFGIRSMSNTAQSSITNANSNANP
jgi:hypothetical protein